MTTRQLSFKGPPQLAIAAGATSPNPGINGVTVWSTTENAILNWSSTSWELLGTGGGAPTEDSIFNPITFDPVHGFTAIASGSGGIFANGSSTWVGGTQSSVAITPGSSEFTARSRTRVTSDAANWVGAAIYNSTGTFQKGDASFGGFVLESFFEFVPATSGVFFAGVKNTSGTVIYADGPDDSVSGLGICGYGSDNLNVNFRLYFGNGTTTNTSTVFTRPAGTRGNPIYKVYIRVPAGSPTAKIWVIDYGVAEYPDGYAILNGYEVDISTLPATDLLESMVGYGTGSSTVARVIDFAFMQGRYWTIDSVFPEAAANITGNAATATALETSRTIQGVPFNGSTNIDVISIGSVAPATPVLNQLWIQTA